MELTELAEQFTISEEVEKSRIKGIIDQLLIEDKFAHDLIIRINKKLELYYKGYQRTFWSYIHNDWDSPDFPSFDPTLYNRNQEDIPDTTTKVFNVFRGYGESIISALAAGIPATKFFPENADNVIDIVTAKAFSKIVKKIEKENDASILFVKALYTLWISHFVAVYNYAHQNPKFGFVTEEVTEQVEVPFKEVYCPNCGSKEIQETPEGAICPNCGPTIPEYNEGMEVEEQVTGYKKTPKIREVIEIYGSLNVQIPSYAFDIKGCPYLRLNREIHQDLARELFPDYYNKISGGPDTVELDRWSRAATELSRGSDQNLVTLSQTWLRPWVFNSFSLEDNERQILKDKYKDGLLVYTINQEIVKIEAENLDDHWTISRNPTSNHLHTEPLGLNMVDVQDVVSELVNIEVQTISYGIGETFVDPEVVNFKAYKKGKSQPGMLTAAAPAPGKSLADSFHTIKSATLSQEVENFQSRVEQYGQFISGAYPSIYGGSMQGGSKTLGEYQDSRAQSLQRLSLTWKMLNILWPEAMEKASREYADVIKAGGQDEHFVEASGDDFVNIWIKVSELTGNIGMVRSESSEQLPVSWAQKRGLILELLGQKNQVLDSVMFDPNNAEFIADVLGFGEIYVPGADDRNVQLEEIKQLVSSQPIPEMQNQPMMDQNGQPMSDPFGNPAVQQVQVMMPSVPIQPGIDNDAVHIAVCRAWLNGPVGRALKALNPSAYENVNLHLQQHINKQMMEMAQQPQPAQEQQ